MKPFFVMVDGPDGVGKGTLIQNVIDNWNREDQGPIRSFYDPGIEEGHPLNTIRTVVKNTDMCPESELLLFQACRLELWQNIQETLDMGVSVILDRGPLSTWVYQAQMKGLKDLVQILGDVFQTRPADLTIVMNAPFEVLTERLESRFATDDPNKDKFKSNEFFRRRVWAEYNKLLKDDPNLIELDSSGTPEDSLKQFHEILEEYGIR